MTQRKKTEIQKQRNEEIKQDKAKTETTRQKLKETKKRRKN